MNPLLYAAVMSTSAEATIIDGRTLASAVRDDVRRRVAALREAGIRVRLDAVLAPGSHAGGGSVVYARNQARACEELGIDHRLHEFEGDVGFDDIAGRVLLLNRDDDVHAVMVHLPLPEGVNTEQVQALIHVDKDVEGVNPANIGNVVYGRRSLVPCTALAAVEMIESTGIDLPGKVCVCVGASNIVGKPIAVLLMQAEATVISTNIHTRNLAEYTRSADVLVAAAGVPGLITGEMVRPGAVVIDVGITRVRDGNGRLRTTGDVDFEAVRRVAGHLSPVPGGVGPMTVAMLLRNAVQAAEQTTGLTP